ncbi:MAG: hypothetical protein ACTSWY_16205 [Promethearchaeota archaeon]
MTEQKKNYRIGLQEFESCGKDIINFLGLKKEMEMILGNAEFYVLGTTSNIDWAKYPQIKVLDSLPDEEKFDVIICVGSILPEQEERVKNLREIADNLVALGTCCVCGTRPTIALSGLTEENQQEINEKIDGMVPEYLDIARKSAKEVVNVNFEISGCPINESSFFLFLMDLIERKLPRLEEAPVCMECKLNGNECLFMTKGLICMGPITRCGCGARCITEDGKPCSGCGGSLPNANLDEWYKMILRYGKSVKDVFNFFVSR